MCIRDRCSIFPFQYRMWVSSRGISEVAKKYPSYNMIKSSTHKSKDKKSQIRDTLTTLMLVHSLLGKKLKNIHEMWHEFYKNFSHFKQPTNTIYYYVLLTTLCFTLLFFSSTIFYTRPY